ncbi:MAG TPA: MMPL family transporter [Myxococcota bacterium]|nr:MMPL family transporter [Myxococcota bacterium]
MDELIGRAVARWVDWIARHPISTLVATAVVTALLGFYSYENLGINMDVAAMLSPDLPHQKTWRVIEKAFPDSQNPLLVVVDAATPERARDAALQLRDRLAQETKLFSSVEVPGEGPFFEKNGLLYLSTDDLGKLSNHLAEVQPYLAELRRDSSLRGLFALLQRAADSLRSGDATVVELAPVFDRLSRAVDAERTGHSEPVSWREVLLGTSLPETPRRVLIVQPIVDYSALIPAEDSIARIHELAQEIGLGADNGIRVRVTGELALSSEELATVTRGTALSGILSFIAVTGILFFGLRSWKLMASTSLTLSVGLVWTFAFATLTVGSLNMVSVAFAVLFIGLGDDFGVHFCLRWQDLYSRGGDSKAALRETAQDVGLSLLLAAITVAIGFLAFAPTDYVGVAELGVISAGGIIMSVIASLTLLPALIVLLKPPTPKPRPVRPPSAWMSRLVAFPVHHARFVRWGALVLAVVCVPFLLRVRFDYNPLRLRVQTADSVTAFNDLLSTDGLSPWSVTVLANDRAQADAIADRLKRLDTVDHTVTLSDFIPTEQEEKLAILEDVALMMAPPPPADRIEAPPTTEAEIAALRAFLVKTDQMPATLDPKTHAALDKLRTALSGLVEKLSSEDEAARKASLDRLEKSVVGSLPDQVHRIDTALQAQPITAKDLPHDLVRDTVAPDGRIRVDAYPKEDLGRDDRALQRFADSATAAMPEATGIAVTTVESARVVVKSFREALLGAALAITLLLLVLWRRISDTLIALAPLLLSAAVLAAIGVIFDLPFNFANVLVLPALLGIGIDSGIHLVHRWRHMAGESDPLLETSTARGVVQSTLTTIASFGTLAISPHPGMASLGVLLTVGLTLTLVANLILIPALVANRPGDPHS